MKKTGFVVLMAFLTAACSNDSGKTSIKLDSIGNKFDSAAEKTWDATKDKANDIKKKIENKLEQRDSAYEKADTSK